MSVPRFPERVWLARSPHHEGWWIVFDAKELAHLQAKGEWSLQEYELRHRPSRTEEP